jgi:hypothetical protein
MEKTEMVEPLKARPINNKKTKKDLKGNPIGSKVDVQKKRKKKKKSLRRKEETHKRGP